MTQHSRRPRVAGSREDEILHATIEMLIEVGYDRLTMDAVAQRAKASKATLYRRWNTKQELVVEAVKRSALTPDPQDVDTGTLRGDLLAICCGPGGFTEGFSTQLTAAVMTAINTEPEFATEFRSKILLPKMAMAHGLFERARQRGELAETTDPELLAPALPGILMHRAFILGEEITEDLIRRVIDQIILPAAAGKVSDATP